MLRGHVRPLDRAAVGIAIGFEIHGNPQLKSTSAPRRRRQLRGQGDALRVRRFRVLRRVDDGHIHRLGQRQHDSFTPLGGPCRSSTSCSARSSPGGVGAGLYGMLVFALLAVFIAGPHGRATPEYLGKKIQAAEMKLVVLYLLIVPDADPRLLRRSRFLIDNAKASILNPGAARSLRDRLRVHVGVEQQWFRLRRTHREHRLVQHDARPRDARRPLPADHPRARDRGLARRKQPAPAVGRHVPYRARRCSSSFSLASSIIVVGAHLLPGRSRSGPISEQLSADDATTTPAAARCSTRAILRRAALSTAFLQARPAAHGSATR